MVAIVKTVAPIGFYGFVIEVECDASNSLPSFQIVGLGNKAIDEAKERVRSAITNSMLDFPRKRIIINLAPAELPKDGAHYDLPIALAILCISGQLRQSELDGSVFAGELALDGSIRPVKGAINIAQIARRINCKQIFLPTANINQASLIDGVEIIGLDSFKQLFLHLKQEIKIQPHTKSYIHNQTPTTQLKYPLLDNIKGQEQAKRALMIAAAGHHNILFKGPPGTGKTMLAKALSNLLPDLTKEEQIAVTKIHSLAGKIEGEIVTKRPFRSPHHTASHISIVGGGNKPKPGEISLAHTGVLFLDELPEYPRATLESLRQPLEDRKIDISRVGNHVSYPANFMLVATMNPCPCGYYGDPKKECSCTNMQIASYQKKLSGPLIDRVDLILNVARVSNEILLDENMLTNCQHLSATKLIKHAIQSQNIRYNSSTLYNSSLSNNDLDKYIKLSKEPKNFLLRATDRLSLSVRSHFKIIRVARTIADLDGENDILVKHIAEALQYRDQ